MSLATFLENHMEASEEGARHQSSQTQTIADDDRALATIPEKYTEVSEEGASAPPEFPDTDENLVFPAAVAYPIIVPVSLVAVFVSCRMREQSRERPRRRRDTRRHTDHSVYVTDEVWQARVQKRRLGITISKSYSEYQQVKLHSRSSRRPRTPDPSDRTLSRNKFEKAMSEWRVALRKEWRALRKDEGIFALVAMGFDEHNVIRAWEAAEKDAMPAEYCSLSDIAEKHEEFQKDAMEKLFSMPSMIVTLSGSVQNSRDLIIKGTNMAGEQIAVLNMSVSASTIGLRGMLLKSLGHPNCNLQLLLQDGSVVGADNAEGSVVKHLGLD